MKMTKEQFINQFPYKVNITKEIERLLAKDSEFEGVEVFRLLNLLVIKLGDDYYLHP